MLDALSKVTSPHLKYWTSSSKRESFKLDLLIAGLALPPQGTKIYGVEPLTKAKVHRVKPLDLNINETLDEKNEDNLKVIASILEDYLIKNPKDFLVVDSNYKYAEAVDYIHDKFLERIMIVEYKPVARPAPVWLAAKRGIYS